MQENKRAINPMLAIGGVLVVLLVIAGAWFLTKNNSNSNPAMTQESTQPTATTEASMQPTGSASATEVNEVTVNVEGGNFYFKPNEIRVKKGQKVKIVFTSKGGTHDFTVDEFNVKTDLTSSGDTSEVQFTPDKTGTFEFYCSVGTHRQMGMKGNLIVE